MYFQPRLHKTVVTFLFIAQLLQTNLASELFKISLKNWLRYCTSKLLQVKLIVWTRDDKQCWASFSIRASVVFDSILSPCKLRSYLKRLRWTFSHQINHLNVLDYICYCFQAVKPQNSSSIGNDATPRASFLVCSQAVEELNCYAKTVVTKVKFMKME